MPQPTGSQTSSPLRIAVTGGAGRIGQVVIGELLEHGHAPTCIDLRVPEGLSRPKPYQATVADLTDLGQVYGQREVNRVVREMLASVEEDPGRGWRRVVT